MVDDLLDGMTSAVDWEHLERRARALGLEPGHSCRAAALRWTGHQFDARFLNALTAAASFIRIACWTTRRDRMLIAIAQRLDGDVGADLKMWTTLHDSMAAALTCGVGSIGVGGRARTLSEIRRSYRQAQQALTIQTASERPHGVTHHDQLGICGLVTAIEADDFVHEWLAPLLDHDRQESADLTVTLTAYFAHATHYTETATSLGIHRSTLGYRLHRIRNLTDYDLADPETRFNLQVATRIWQGLR